jgi:death on curing protein
MGELPDEIFFFEAQQVIETHNLQLEENGGGLPGLTTQGMNALESALAQPKTGMIGAYFHSNLFLMAAAYMYHIANGHCFLDGNKRTALAVALEFLAFHGLLVYGTEVDFLRLIFKTVSSGEFTAEDLPPEIAPAEVNTVLTPEAMKLEIAEFFKQHVIAVAS